VLSPHVDKYPMNSTELNNITLFIVNVWGGAGTSNPLTPIHATPIFFVIRRYTACTSMTIDPSSFKNPRTHTAVGQQLESKNYMYEHPN
jgi:hypothetical protein